MDNSDTKRQDSGKHPLTPALNRTEKWVRALRAGLQLLPLGIGSFIESGYFGTIDDRRTNRLEKFIASIASDLRALQSKMAEPDPEFFQSDQFGFFFENVMRRVASEVSDAKLNALKGALVSILVEQRIGDFDKQSSFVRTIDAFEGIHIQILQFLASKSHLADSERYVSHSEICNKFGAAKESDVNFVYSALDTLANREFILSGGVPMDKDNRILKERQRFRATALGIEFLKFVRVHDRSSAT